MMKGHTELPERLLTHSILQSVPHARGQHDGANHQQEKQEHEVKEPRGDTTLHFPSATAQAAGSRAQTTAQQIQTHLLDSMSSRVVFTRLYSQHSVHTVTLPFSSSLGDVYHHTYLQIST